jgi:hypothetical protein
MGKSTLAMIDGGRRGFESDDGDVMVVKRRVIRDT